MRTSILLLICATLVVSKSSLYAQSDTTKLPDSTSVQENVAMNNVDTIAVDSSNTTDTAAVAANNIIATTTDSTEVAATSEEPVAKDTTELNSEYMAKYITSLMREVIGFSEETGNRVYKINLKMMGVIKNQEIHATHHLHHKLFVDEKEAFDKLSRIFDEEQMITLEDNMGMIHHKVKKKFGL